MGLLERAANGPVTRVYRKIKLTTGWTIVVASGLSFDDRSVDPVVLDSRYEVVQVTDDDLREMARRHPQILPEGMTVEERITRRDRAVVITCGDELVSFVWYSFEPTPALHPDLICHFGPGWVYGHSAWVHREHRGQRLIGVASTMGNSRLADEGRRGLVLFTEIDNRPSLRAGQSTGFEVFGYAVVGRAFGRWLHALTPGCRPSGFRLAPARDQGPTRTGK